jgi:predicted nucleic acid-binding protein
VILVDTSVWIDHLRSGDARLHRLLGGGAVLCHPWVIGELALGHLSQRQEILRLLAALPTAPVADPGEVLAFVERNNLMGRGIGYVDVQLLAASRLAAAPLWSRDKRLVACAASLGCAFTG